MSDRKPEFPTPWRVDRVTQSVRDADGYSLFPDWRYMWWPHLKYEEAMQQFDRIVAAVNAAEGAGYRRGFRDGFRGGMEAVTMMEAKR